MSAPSAIVLTAAGLSAADRNLRRVLEFFGVPVQVLPGVEFPVRLRQSSGAGQTFSLLCPAAVFLQLAETLSQMPELQAAWKTQVHSVFVHAGDDPGALAQLVGLLAGPGAELRKSRATIFTVTDQWNEFCGVMAGTNCPVAREEAGEYPALNGGDALPVITSEGGAVLVKLAFDAVPVLLTTAREMVDLDEESTRQNFELPGHYLSALPLVLFVKWAFARICWRAPEVNACLVIDDPLLKPDYGYVNYAKFLALMEQNAFTTNIAFIPWNCRRSHPRVVQMFRENPGKFSLSVHGCNHTAGEFGRPDKNWLMWRTRQAVARMARHAAATGIVHDRVMVFPQGIFTDAAPGILKQHGFVAIVNNHIHTADPQPRPLKTSSAWDVAAMDYDSFPIFTRRYPQAGTASFAWDILLGKPCIMLVHHEDCWDGCAALVKAIRQLNALSGPMHWRSLGEVVRRACRQRPLPSGEIEVEMYGSELHLENNSPQARRFLVGKRETDPGLIKEIHLDNQPVSWRCADGRVKFEVELQPGQSLLAGIRFQTPLPEGPDGLGLAGRMKAGLRRYLCEVRDNYVTKIRYAIRPPVHR